jgi:hypothetical protein
VGHAGGGIQHHWGQFCEPSNHFTHDTDNAGVGVRRGWNPGDHYGTNFQPGAIVLFGTAPGVISGVTCVESGGTTITSLTPGDSDGAKDVTVVNVDGQSSSATAAYTSKM